MVRTIFLLQYVSDLELQRMGARFRPDRVLLLWRHWSLRAIWTALSEHKELTCGYKTFIAHVRRLQQQAATTPKAITPEKRKGFTWDPTPNREELIG